MSPFSASGKPDLESSVPGGNAANPLFRENVLVWSVFGVLLILNYLATFRWMIARWEEPGSYMSHGWLIPPITAWLLWMERKAIAPALVNAGARWGWAALLAALLLHIISGLADVSSISGLTLIPLVLGFAALRHGWGLIRIIWFPIVFLAFMIPPPEFIISTINFQLKLMASDIAAWLLNLTGLPAVRTGSFMLFGEERLAIGDVCSGLRSLLSLLSIGVLYAWLIRDKGKAHVAIVLLASIPAAIIGNGLRICIVAYLVYWFGQDVVFKPFLFSWDLHLLTGGFIFAGALSVLVGASALVGAVFPGAKPRA